MTMNRTSTTIATAIAPPKSEISTLVALLVRAGSSGQFPCAYPTVCFPSRSSMTGRRLRRLRGERLNTQDEAFLPDDPDQLPPLDRCTTRRASGPFLTQDVNGSRRIESALDLADRARRQQSTCAA